MNFSQFQQWWASVSEPWKKIILEENLNISSKAVEKNFKKILNLTSIDTGFDDKLNKKIQDFDDLKMLKKLKKITCRSLNISNIDALQNFPSLQELYICPAKLKDISVISKLSNLQVLTIDVEKCKHINLTPIKSLQKLKELSVTAEDPFKAIVDFTPIKFLKNLERLELYFSNKINITLFSDLKKLKELSIITLRESQIINVAPLKNLINLEDLDCRCKITSIEQLKNLKKLKVLRCANESLSGKDMCAFIQKHPTCVIWKDDWGIFNSREHKAHLSKVRKLCLNK